MAYAWVVIRNWKPANADIPSLAADFKLAVDQIDPDFGVMGISGTDHTAMIDEGELPRLAKDYPDNFDGVNFSNPRMDHFGPFGGPS